MSGHDWLFWALLSAFFAALTAIFTKLGLEGVDPDLANLLRTVFILAVVIAFVLLTGKWSNPFDWPGHTWLFLALSALATGASWICYFRRFASAMRIRSLPSTSSASSWWPCSRFCFWVNGPVCASGEGLF